MLRLAWALALGAASSACGMAAVGVALYAHGPMAWAAAQWFGAIGLVSGLVCGGLHLWLVGPATPQATPLPAQALAGLVRATLATATAERQVRPGSAADRQPAPAAMPLAALAARPGAVATAGAGLALAAPAGPGSATPAPAAPAWRAHADTVAQA